MSLRRRSVLLRVALLVLVPLLFLIGLFTYTVTTSVSSALTLIRSKVMLDDLGPPVAGLQQALTRERAQVIVYDSRPTPAAQAALAAQQRATNRAVAAVTAATDSSSVRQSASAGGTKAIAALRASLAGLPGLRARIAGRAVGGAQAFAAYSGMIAASYQVLEQAVIQDGNSAQVLPGIAVIELAISNEYLQQESALLNGDFAARAFPAADHQAFVRLVGAHRLLYAQSYSYLNPADRSALNHDVSPQAAGVLAAMENKLVASDVPGRAPPVRPAAWDSTVATISAQTQRAVGQAEAGLAAGARAQASAKLRNLYLVGGLSLAAVIVSLALSLLIAINLARRLRGLRDSALEMAEIRLPDVVQRLRAGEDVDVAEQAPFARPGPDEIGQVKAAFNTAQRTAVEAAVDEARVRRGINDVFRNLARRSQALLERQMTLLDTLERQADEPEHLESLYRIDHLTTRMRRHAESLIVLAGDAPKRSFRNPVPFVDVLRAAAAEVEDYQRVRVICRAPAALAGPAVADVIHMLAELVENATIFSPPNTEVRVLGDLVANGFAVEIEDRGLGMSDEEISAANMSLASPPLFDLSGSDRFGLFVAAQLARRHGIRVTLRPSAYGGATAIVLLPRDLVIPANALGNGAASNGAAGGEPGGGAAVTGAGDREGPDAYGPSAGRDGDPGQPASRGPNGRVATTVRPVVAAQPITAPPVPVPPPAPAPRPPAAPPSAAAPPPPPSAAAPPPVAAPPPAAAPPSAAPPPPPSAPASPARSGISPLDPGWTGDSAPGRTGDGADGLAGDGPAGRTENGLPRRIRQASLAPQLRNRPASDPPGGAPAGDPPGGTTAGGTTAGARSPEKARSVMSAFRRGWQRGVGAPDAGQHHGTDLPQHGEGQ